MEDQINKLIEDLIGVEALKVVSKDMEKLSTSFKMAIEVLWTMEDLKHEDIKEWASFQSGGMCNDNLLFLHEEGYEAIRKQLELLNGKETLMVYIAKFKSELEKNTPK